MAPNNFLEGIPYLSNITTEIYDETKRRILTNRDLARDRLHSIRKRKRIKTDNKLHTERDTAAISSVVIGDDSPSKSSGGKSNQRNPLIDLPFSKNDMSKGYNDVFSDRLGEQTQSVESNYPRTVVQRDRKINLIMLINKQRRVLRKRDLLDVGKENNVTTNKTSNPSGHDMTITTTTQQHTAGAARTERATSHDECFSFVSCVQPYISYVAGTIMFILVLYLIIVFGRCVCDDSF